MSPLHVRNYLGSRIKAAVRPPIREATKTAVRAEVEKGVTSIIDDTLEAVVRELEREVNAVGGVPGPA